MRSILPVVLILILAAGICLIPAFGVLPVAGTPEPGPGGTAPAFPPELSGFRFTRDGYPYVVEIRDYDHPILPEEAASMKEKVIAAYRERINPGEFTEAVFVQSARKEDDLIVAYGYFIDRGGAPHILEYSAGGCQACHGEDPLVARTMLRWLDTDLGPFIADPAIAQVK